MHIYLINNKKILLKLIYVIAIPESCYNKELKNVCMVDDTIRRIRSLKGLKLYSIYQKLKNERSIFPLYLDAFCKDSTGE